MSEFANHICPECDRLKAELEETRMKLASYRIDPSQFDIQEYNAWKSKIIDEVFRRMDNDPEDQASLSSK